MKHVSLGGLDVSRIGLGAMTMAGPRSTARSTARSWSGGR